MKLEDLKCVDNNINLDKYIEYREYTKSNMQYPEWLGDFTKEDLKELLDNGTKIWLYYLNNDFVCSMMSIPSNEEDMIKFDLDLKDFYDENEEIMINEAIERFGTQKINVLKKVLPDFIKYPTIRAVLLDKMLYKVKL